MNNNSFPVTEPVARLIDEFSKLPGIGPKSAQRLTFYLIRMPHDQTQALAEAMLSVKERITFCQRCQNITEFNPCTICSNPRRDSSRICVVEEPLDALAIERTNAYKGLYHVLHGVISPMNNVGPSELRIAQLLDRIREEQVSEVILATNPSLEGEATAMYIHRLLGELVPQITRLARGLPAGGDLEYADDVTLTRALEGRQEF
jgi:recombination protein RecR